MEEVPEVGPQVTIDISFSYLFIGEVNLGNC